MVNRRRRSLGRWLAPVALITCAVAVYAVVDNTLLKDDAATKGNDSSQQATPKKTTTGKAAKTPKRRRAYVVKSGDTRAVSKVRRSGGLNTRPPGR